MYCDQHVYLTSIFRDDIFSYHAESSMMFGPVYKNVAQGMNFAV